MGILRKEPGKGGKDRKSNSYTFLGADRSWAPLPVGRPDTNPIVALAQARRLIEELQAKAARVDDLEAELALLRNGHANGHSGVTNGEDDPPARPPGDSYETADSGTSQETHGAIGHSGVTNGLAENPAEEASHSYETADPGNSQETHGAIGHSAVTNGPDEGQEYLSRRARVQDLVMNHRDYYKRSFNRGGLPSAVEYFSRSPGHEQELMDQVALLEAGGDPRQSGAGPPTEPGSQDQSSANSDRYAVGQCPDCGRPFATHGGATHCSDCTERRRRESEA